MIKAFATVRRILTPDERTAAALLLALMIAGVVLETVCTGLVIPAVALLTQPDFGADYPRLAPLLDAVGRPSQAGLIVAVMLGLVAVYLLKNLFLAFLAWRQTRFAFSVQADLSQRLFSLYLGQPYTFHLQRNSSELIRNVSGETAMFTHVLANGLTLLSEALVLAAISALLLAVEPLGTLIAAVVLAGAAWAFHRGTRARIGRWGEERQLHEGLRHQHLQQGLGGAKDVKVLGREAEFLAQYQAHNARSASAGQRQAAMQMLPRLWLELLAIAGLATLAMAMLAQGRAPATIVPTLALFAVAAFRLLPAVDRMLSAVQALRYSAPVIETLDAELRLSPPPPAAPRGAAAAFRDDIRLAGVSFTYPGAAAPALRDVSLSIRKGDTVGFVGESGSGKSTLVDLLLGLLVPQSGQVLVDGRSVHDDLRAWQDHIGYVPQTIYLTDDSIRRNVAFGVPAAEIDDERVSRALRQAQLDDFVAGLPEGAETVVGERGVRLSGGQRQRIGIARALYHDPGVLVLDEATSALDTATEQGVIEAVSALHGTKTVLIVAHRLSTVAHCDRLYRLERGQAAEESVAVEERA